MQGGAFVANTGSVASMLFNPAGLAKMPGRFTAAIEAGWASETEYLDYFNVNFTTGFQPVQFAGIALQPIPKLTIGAYYARPSNYNIDLGRITFTTVINPDGIAVSDELDSRREHLSLGLTLATSLGDHVTLGGGAEWRRASIQEEFFSMRAEGDAEAVRFSAGAIFRISQWCLGIAAQSKYKATGDISLKNDVPFVLIDVPPGQVGNNQSIYQLSSEKFPFSNEDPATIRFGAVSPYAFGRLRFSADAEFKDFKSDEPIERWQFYGGGTFKLVSGVHLGFGAFTFRKDYSAYIEGPKSETFWTVGATVEISQFRFSGSFMDGDLFSKDFAGQKFANCAIGFVIP